MSMSTALLWQRIKVIYFESSLSTEADLKTQRSLLLCPNTLCVALKKYSTPKISSSTRRNSLGLAAVSSSGLTVKITVDQSTPPLKQKKNQPQVKFIASF